MMNKGIGVINSKIWCFSEFRTL